MSEHKELDNNQIKHLLTSTRAPKGLSTEPRDIATWYKQNHILRDEGCTNPACTDDRPKGDVGRKIVIMHNSEFMCRTCFLEGWLSPNA